MDNSSEIQYSVLKSFTDQDFADLQALVAQLSLRASAPAVNAAPNGTPTDGNAGPNGAALGVSAPADNASPNGGTPRLGLTREHLQRVVADPAVTLCVARLITGPDPLINPIIGCAVLVAVDSLSGRLGRVEDVVVREDARGRGVGRALMEFVLAEAAKLAPIELQLTSKPARVAANALYRSLGFELKQTNCYVKRI